MRKSLIELIPYTPHAVSVVRLAHAAGYMKKTDEKGVEKALRKLERRLAWLTFADRRIFERRAVVQDSTREFAEENDIAIKDEELSYLSLMKDE